MPANESLEAMRGPQARAQCLAASRRLLWTIMAWLREAGRRRRDQRVLSAMTHRELEDIGLSRTDDCISPYRRLTDGR